MGLGSFFKNIGTAALKTALVPAVVIVDVASGNNLDITTKTVASAAEDVIDAFDNLSK
jgi:hypothetical protein